MVDKATEDIMDSAEFTAELDRISVDKKTLFNQLFHKLISMEEAEKIKADEELEWQLSEIFNEHFQVHHGLYEGNENALLGALIRFINGR